MRTYDLPMDPMECPTEETLDALLVGGLTPEERERVQRHVDGCPDCLARMVGAAGGGSTGAPASQAPALAHTLAAPRIADHGSPPEWIEEYRLLRPLGQGAMGQVYIAHDTLLDRPVAIKFLAACNPDAADRQRFVVEARAIARLSHP